MYSLFDPKFWQQLEDEFLWYVKENGYPDSTFDFVATFMAGGQL